MKIEENSNPKKPLVSVIVPVRNEAKHIGGCLNSLVNQDYPKERLEILAAEGLSEDGTAAILSGYEDRYPFIQSISNPSRSTAAGLNLGVEASKGDIIIILSAHSRVAPTFVSQGVEFLEKTGDDCVGGPVEAVGEGYLGRVIALVLSSPFGVGGARFRYAQRAQHVDTVAYGAYRIEVFKKIGLFDERLERNQDIEFNYRLRRAGGKIFLTPSIRSYYYGPQTIPAFLQQAYDNGFWNIKTLFLVGFVLSYRHLAPLVFLLSLIVPLVLSAFAAAGGYLLTAILLAYGSAAIASSALISFRQGVEFLPVLPFLFLGLHLSYGCGSFVALLSFLKRGS